MKKALALSLSLLFATQVNAQSELATLLEVLKDNGTISVEQYQRLMSEQQDKQAETPAIPTVKQPVDEQPNVSVKNGIKVTAAIQITKLERQLMVQTCHN